MDEKHKNNLKRRSIIQKIGVASGVSISGLAGCISSGRNDSSDDTALLNLGYAGQEDSPQDQGGKLLRDTIEEKSDGEIEVEVNNSQSVGGPAEVLESTEQRTLDMGVSAVNNLAEFTDAWYFTQLPYLWEDHQNMYDFFNESDAMEEVNETVQEDIGNIELLGYWGSNGGSMRQMVFTNDSTPKVPSDVDGDEIRVTESPIEKTTVDEWGFNATQISWSETIPAMRDGVVDGIHIHYGWFYDDGVYEEANYVVETSTQDSPCAIYINNETFDGLSDEHQNILEESVQEVIPQQTEIDIEHGEKRKQDALDEKSDLTIYEPSDEELEEWIQVAGPVYDEWVGDDISEELVRSALEFQDYEVPGINL